MEHSHKLRQFIEGERQASDTGEDELEELDDEQRSKSSSVVRSAGDLNSISSISTSILDNAEELKILKEKLCHSEQRCAILERDVNQMILTVKREREKNEKLEKKLKFVKDNQEVFMRLKEAYINMKYNEAAGRKMVEIREKGNQTWEGILCRSCLETEQVRRNIENFRKDFKESFIINPMDMQRLSNTIKYLKDVVERREQQWENKRDRELQLQLHVKTIEDENKTLKNILQCRSVNENNVNAPVDTKCAELSQLKKIIIKFEKRFRELDKFNNQEMQMYFPAFNEKEKKIIQNLIDKYYVKYDQKVKDRRPDDARSAAGSRPASRRCRSKSRESDPKYAANFPDHTGDLTMNMIDHILHESPLY